MLIHTEMSILYHKGLPVKLSLNILYVFLSLKFVFLAKCVDPYNAAIHLGLHCLPSTCLPVSRITPGRRQSKTPILSRNVDQKSIETVFSIVICRPTMAIENTASIEF